MSFFDGFKHLYRRPYHLEAGSKMVNIVTQNICGLFQTFVSEKISLLKYSKQVGEQEENRL